MKDITFRLTLYCLVLVASLESVEGSNSRTECVCGPRETNSVSPQGSGDSAATSEQQEHRAPEHAPPSVPDSTFQILRDAPVNSPYVYVDNTSPSAAEAAQRDNGQGTTQNSLADPWAPRAIGGVPHYSVHSFPYRQNSTARDFVPEQFLRVFPRSLAPSRAERLDVFREEFELTRLRKAVRRELMMVRMVQQRAGRLSPREAALTARRLLTFTADSKRLLALIARCRLMLEATATRSGTNRPYTPVAGVSRAQPVEPDSRRKTRPTVKSTATSAQANGASVQANGTAAQANGASGRGIPQDDDLFVVNPEFYLSWAPKTSRTKQNPKS